MGNAETCEFKYHIQMLYTRLISSKLLMSRINDLCMIDSVRKNVVTDGQHVKEIYITDP